MNVQLVKSMTLEPSSLKRGSLWWTFHGMWSKLCLITFLIDDIDDDIEVMIIKLGIMQ